MKERSKSFSPRFSSEQKSLRQVDTMTRIVHQHTHAIDSADTLDNRKEDSKKWFRKNGAIRVTLHYNFLLVLSGIGIPREFRFIFTRQICYRLWTSSVHLLSEVSGET